MTTLKGAPTLLTEKQFGAQIEELFTTLGWWYHHTFDSRHGAPGMPDYVLVHPKHGIIFAELKTEKGRLTPAQEQAIDRINKAARANGWPRIAVVWRPHDFEKIVDIAQRGLRHVDTT